MSQVAQIVVAVERETCRALRRSTQAATCFADSIQTNNDAMYQCAQSTRLLECNCVIFILRSCCAYTTKFKVETSKSKYRKLQSSFMSWHMRAVKIRHSNSLK